MIFKNVDNTGQNNSQDDIGFLGRLKQAVLSFLQCLSLFTIFVFCLAVLIAFVAADCLYRAAPALVTNSYEETAKRVAAQMINDPAKDEILQTMHQYNLSWFYISKANNNLVTTTIPYSPDIKNLNDKKSHLVLWRGNKYFDAVAPLDKNEFLHLGFSLNSLLPHIDNYQSFLSVPYFALPLNFGMVLMALAFTLISLLIAFKYAVSGPLQQLAQACSSLFLARDAYSDIIKGGLTVSALTVSEVKKMARGLIDVRRQYDGQFFARAKKAEELEIQRSSHAKIEQELNEQFKEKIADAQQSLTELQAKESDEEFIASLAHAIDSLSSKRQICQRILDRLNDKYPTSIIHAALFMLEDKALNVEASIGLDDRALQTLERVDHNSFASELFELGSYIELGLNSLRERGLQELALQLSIKRAVYLPFSFQRRNLGILAVYFPIQGQSINDRIRLLRKVVELISRQLYQMTLYQEELEASRTDPLTGFRNRKYFYEIIPQVLERASIDPEKSPFSIIMVDVDHFKKVNDTFGHQIGDEVLRVISSSIKNSVRTEGDHKRPGDCIIRFGGEEFLVILEKTSAQNAERVAERVRSAVEKRTDWPSGIARCTVSIGIATYPEDGSDVENIVLRADTALYYVKNELGRNNFCHSATIPKTFKWAKTKAKIVGELGVFEPSNLLQALAGANKSGILTVKSSRGQNCWILFDKGMLIKASLDNYRGNQALIEFLATFQEDGNFQFQEKSNDANSAVNLNLDDSYNVTGSLTKILLDAALAKDRLDAAQSIISTEEAILTLAPRDEYTSRLDILKRLPEPPSREELKLLNEMAQKIDGISSLKQIFGGLDTIPSALLWHVAALLVQHELAHQKTNP